MLDSVKWSKNEYTEYIIKRVTSSSNTVVPIITGGNLIWHKKPY